MQRAPSGRASLALAVVLVACSGHDSGRAVSRRHPRHVVPEHAVDGPPSAPVAAGAAAARVTRQADALRGAGDVLVYADGRAEARIPQSVAEARGLTVVDLSDGWLPFALSEQPELGRVGTQPYAATYRALADERFRDAPAAEGTHRDQWLELYGIFPDFRVLAARLDDDARHACHAAVDDAELARVAGTVRPTWEDVEARQRVVALYDLNRGKLTRARVAAGVSRDEEVPAEPDIVNTRRRLRQLAPRVEPALAIQAHLRCEGLLPRQAVRGVFDAPTMLALRAYQREHFAVGAAVVDPETRILLVADSRELDFHALLRALRERVVDATGLVEDGSAGNAWGTVLGRDLDAREMHELGATQPPLANAAPDLVSPATEAAARALGWTSPAAARAFFHGLGASDRRDLRVAVRLPEPPAWHAPHMELRAEIDRGDVWYDYPYTGTGRPRPQPVTRRPSLVVYARDRGHEVALLRWPTTVGGWKPERTAAGGVGLRYKGSEPGARVWRQVVATPTWMPPDTTPDDELVRRDGPPGWALTRDLFGPSYASAYGLVMLVHEKPLTRPGTPPYYFDRGIRTHGSVSYGSILHGQSHGCHRLFNHLAIRLASFLLAHRAHVRRGPSDAAYQRTVVAHGHTFDLRIPTRGMVWELTPPVDVLVRAGTVRGHTPEPIRGLRPLPAALAARAQAAAAADEQ